MLFLNVLEGPDPERARSIFVSDDPVLVDLLRRGIAMRLAEVDAAKERPRGARSRQCTEKVAGEA